MAFNIAALHAAADNVALKVRTIEAAAVTLEADRVALVARVQGWADADWEDGPLAALMVETSELTGLRNKARAFVKAMCDQSLKAESLSLSDWYGAGRTMAQRLPPEFGQLVRANAGLLDPRYVWPPLGTILGDADFPGATINQTIVTAPIDTKQYAGGILGLKVKTAPIDTTSGGDVTVVVNGLQYNGDAWQGTATLAHAAAIGHIEDVVPAIANTFCVQITSMTGPTADWIAGAFDVVVVDDRTPAA